MAYRSATAKHAARGNARRAPAFRPAVDRLETIRLMTLTPLVGQYILRPNETAATRGQADFAVYDSTTSSFYVASSADAAHARVAVQLGDPTHANVPLVGQYLPKLNQQAGYSGLSDFAVYDKTAGRFYVASVADPNNTRIGVAIGDPSHAVTPLVKQYIPKLNQQGLYYGGLDDFAIYDATTSSFYVASVADPVNTRLAVQLGDPSHANTPLAGQYLAKIDQQGLYNGVADFAVYDALAGTFYVASAADPTRTRASVQIGDPRHLNVPLVEQYIPKVNQDGLAAGLADYAVYDTTTSTFYVASAADAAHVRIVVQLGDPRHANVPLVGQYIPKLYQQSPYGGLSDFVVYDKNAASFDLASAADPTSNRVAVQLGTPSHANVPLVARFLPKTSQQGIYNGLPDPAVYDATAAGFDFASDVDPVRVRYAVQIGDPSHG